MEQNTTDNKELTDDEEQLVADLAGEFSDKFRAGEAVDIKDYLARLPDERLRQDFMEVIDMDRFLTVMEDIKK
jgi:hypothetical protein